MVGSTPRRNEGCCYGPEWVGASDLAHREGDFARLTRAGKWGKTLFFVSGSAKTSMGIMSRRYRLLLLPGWMVWQINDVVQLSP
jgi:hypothetical protein